MQPLRPTTLTFAALALLLAASPAESAPALTGQKLADEYARCWELFNQRAFPDFAKCYSATAVSISPGLPDAKGGKDIVEKHVKPFVAAMPDVKGELQLTLASGNNVASIALIRGTHTGPLAAPGGAIPATNKKVGILMAHAVQSGGQSAAVKEWSIQDNGAFLAQLGLSPAPARAAITTSWPTRPVVAATGSPTEKANLAAAKKLYALFNKHDKACFDLLADGIVNANQSLPADLKGKEAVVGFISGFWQMASDVKLKASTLFAAGDYVVAIAEFGGTNDGDHPGMGLKKTGKKFNVSVIEISKWQDGKIVEMYPFFDSMQMAGQLGLLPPPAVAKAK